MTVHGPFIMGDKVLLLGYAALLPEGLYRSYQVRFFVVSYLVCLTLHRISDSFPSYVYDPLVKTRWVISRSVRHLAIYEEERHEIHHLIGYVTVIFDDFL